MRQRVSALSSLIASRAPSTPRPRGAIRGRRNTSYRRPNATFFEHQHERRTPNAERDAPGESYSSRLLNPLLLTAQEASHNADPCEAVPNMDRASADHNRCQALQAGLKLSVSILCVPNEKLERRGRGRARSRTRDEPWTGDGEAL